MDRFEQAFWSGQSLEELYKLAVGAADAIRWRRCSSPPCANGSAASRAMPARFAGLQMRIEKVMDVTIAREIERLERRLLVLATVGSAGPFIGLFGTVWGIMTSFQSIAASKNTSLAVVAPGIAEALFATAIGLIAAIPATIFYNKFVIRGEQAGAAAGGVRRRVLRDPVAADRRARRDGRWRMAMSGGSAAGGRPAAAPPRPVMSEINVTPMVDVMLVLLIIFMVSAPLLTVGVPIDLPQTPGQEPRPGQRAADGLGQPEGQGLPAEYRDQIDELVPKLKAITEARGGFERAHLCARRQARWITVR